MQSDSPMRSSPTWRAGPLPWIVLSVGILITLLNARQLYLQAIEKERSDLRADARLTIEQVRDQRDSYLALLRGIAGLFAASESVTFEEFRTYLARLRLSLLYDSVQGVGFAPYVSGPQHLAALEQEAQHVGFDTYRVWPPGARETYVPVLFIGPLTSRHRRALGYDMYSEPRRRAAMEKARDTASVAASELVALVQNPGSRGGAWLLDLCPGL